MHATSTRSLAKVPIALSTASATFPKPYSFPHTTRFWLHTADESVLDFLSELGIGFCNIDQPLLGKALKPSAERTSPIGYVRLHGRNYQNWFAENKRSSDRYDYLYAMKELEPWADRVRSISEKRRESVYVVTNNHFEGKAAVNALQFASLLTDRPVDLPEQLLARYPQLRDIAETHESKSPRHRETAAGE